MAWNGNRAAEISGSRRIQSVVSRTQTHMPRHALTKTVAAFSRFFLVVSFKFPRIPLFYTSAFVE